MDGDGTILTNAHVVADAIAGGPPAGFGGSFGGGRGGGGGGGLAAGLPVPKGITVTLQDGRIFEVGGPRLGLMCCWVGGWAGERASALGITIQCHTMYCLLQPRSRTRSSVACRTTSTTHTHTHPDMRFSPHPPFPCRRGW